MFRACSDSASTVSVCAQVQDGRWLPKEFLVQHGGFDGWSAEQLREEEQVRTAAPASIARL